MAPSACGPLSRLNTGPVSGVPIGVDGGAGRPGPPPAVSVRRLNPPNPARRQHLRSMPARLHPQNAVNDPMKRKILALLEGHRIMTIATLRPDGWPQATTVGYVHEGLTLWFLCGRESQKARNLALDSRVSITIDHDTPDIMAITGLSMAARADRVTDPSEARKVIGMLLARYPDAPPPAAAPTMPGPEDVAVFRVSPEIVSVLDYTLGFAHTDLVRC